MDIAGWTLLGPLGSTNHCVASINFLSGGQEPLSVLIERMYNTYFTKMTESSKEMMSIKERKALAIMESMVQMIGGHYELCLPWKYENPCPSNNRTIAVERLDPLKRHLLKDEDLKRRYKEMVEENISLCHAWKVSVWYLPHHPVVHPQNQTK